GQDEVRVATDDPLVPLVQRTPTAVHLEGVGDGPQAVPAADGVGAVGGVVRGACGMPAGRPRGEVLLLLLGAGATMPAGPGGAAGVGQRGRARTLAGLVRLVTVSGRFGGRGLRVGVGGRAGLG